jgi:diguanylate cyclase (GGDEF)-like protein
MVTHPDYEIQEQIYESKNTQVFRALRISDGKKVSLKIPNSDYPNAEMLSHFRREYEIIKSLQSIDGIINVYDLVASKNTLILVEEDCESQTLAYFIQKQRFDLLNCLKISIQLVETIAQVHQFNIIHKDINPANILWHQEQQKLKLIDFGISSLLSQEYHDFQNPNQLEGTFAYMSPEQTGRVNRLLDYRSDLYSLGVSLYQLFTGQLPFIGEQGIELVHAHIALLPEKADKINKSLPAAISQVIMKLLNKMAEERYQSAWGVLHDLNFCLQQLENTANIDNFIPGLNDFSTNLQIPQKLYGREEEIATILTTFERVSKGSSELLLVSGYSGTGKSSLVHEVHQPLTEKHGIYISGKFDQYQRDVPYFAWSSAIEEFVHLLFKENEDNLSLWRKQILNELGSIAKVITDFSPTLEIIIGSQPEVPELTGEQALNRFNYVFGKLLRVIANKKHPLIIFIDDWQWADIASINLLKYLMFDNTIQHMLIVAAWRDNEVDNIHLFSLAVEEFRKKDIPLTSIQLQNLKQEHIQSMLNEALNSPPEVISLVQLLFKKTLGNAFFLIQFLKNLYQQSLLQFNSEHQYWQWDLNEIQVKNISDNVVQLMTSNILNFDVKKQKILQFAACIGNRFQLDTLAIILKQDKKQVAIALESALQEGIIRPLDNNYRFAAYEENISNVTYQFIHDRLHQAAYGLIPEKQKEQLHVDIAEILINSLTFEQQQQRLFEIVNHFNISKKIITLPKQLQQLVELNFLAGKKARETTAYAPALQYFSTAIDSLPKDAWQNQYILSSKLYLLAAEMAFLSKQYQQMESWLDQYLIYASTPLLQVEACEIRLRAYIAQNNLKNAVNTALYALNLLGVSLPKQPNNFDVLFNLLKTKFCLRGKNFDDLIALPEMSNPIKQKVMSILGLTIPPAYWTSQELVSLIVFQMIRESVEHGYSENTGYAFSWWGITLGAALGDIEKGYKFGEFGVKIAQTHNLNLQQPLFFQGWITQQFKDAIHLSIDVLQKAYKLALEKGDFEYASYALNNYIQAMFHSGTALPELLERMTQTHKDLENFKVGSSLYWHDICWQTTLNFNHFEDEPTYLKGNAYDENINIKQHLSVNDLSTLFLLYFSKLMLSIFFSDYKKAYLYSKKARQYLKGGVGMYAFVLFHFYESLALLEQSRESSFVSKKILYLRVKKNQKKLHRWAQYSPTNHLHRYHLVEAEYFSISGRNDLASQSYELAINEAHNNGFIHDEALFCEYTARFYNQRQQQRLSKVYAKQALKCYQQWGAQAKINHLLENFPYLYKNIKHFSSFKLDGTTQELKSSTAGNSLQLDVASLLKASQAISSTIVLDDLIKTLLANVLENAGAQRGLLILKKNGKLYVEAQGHVSVDEITVMQSLPVEKAHELLPVSMLYYVERSQTPLLLDNTKQLLQFSQDSYFIKSTPNSVLCYPILHQGQLTGLLYLENNLTQGAFNNERLELLNLLTAQAAISIKNSSLYTRLEDQVEERTQELQESLNKQKQLNEELITKSKKLDGAYEEIRTANEQLQFQANTDVLTGLFNRRYFNEFLEYEYHRCAREKQPLSILMCDIDNFKGYNDQYGHHQGDKCLQQVANAFNQIFTRSVDIVARYGGEEIVVILSKTDKIKAYELAEKLRSTLEAMQIEHMGNGKYQVVTISIGGNTVIPNNTERADIITQDADIALYQAKENGRNQVVFSPLVDPAPNN